MGDLERVLALLGESTTTTPKVSTECPHFVKPTPKEWCASCSGIEDDERGVPVIHDGRHGRSCGRCMFRYHRDLNATRLRP